MGPAAPSTRSPSRTRAPIRSRPHFRSAVAGYTLDPIAAAHGGVAALADAPPAAVRSPAVAGLTRERDGPGGRDGCPDPGAGRHRLGPDRAHGARDPGVRVGRDDGAERVAR